MQSFASSLESMISSTNGRLSLSFPSLNDSAPTTIPTSMIPVRISFAICCVAVKPDEQKREMLDAAEVLGKPAARVAARA